MIEAIHVQCSGFGELALLYSAPRAATVRASSPCKLWVMDRAVYNVIKMEATQSTAAHKRKLLNAVPLLSVLSQVCLILNDTVTINLKAMPRPNVR